MRRALLGGVLAIGMSAGLGMAAAMPATADQWDCTFYLFTQGYGGYYVDIGCNYGAQGNESICLFSLRIAGVPDATADEACRRAALP